MNHRYGGDEIDIHEIEEHTIKDIKCLEPGMKVYKRGRTTGETSGNANNCILQTWEDQTVTTEIAVIPTETREFGRRGDSGSLVVTEVNRELYRVGMLIAVSQTGVLGIVTPLQIILDDVQAKTGEIITITKPVR